MDVLQLLDEMGEAPPAHDAVIQAAVDLVLAASHQESPPGPAPSNPIVRRRPVVVVAAALATMAAAVVAVVLLVPAGGPGSPTTTRPGARPGGHAPRVITSAMVRLISLQSGAATADTGTAVETTTNTVGATIQGEPTTIDVTFSGPNVNYEIVGDGAGAAGVENRVVDGQLYLYVKGPDLQMHWYHDTSPDAAASMSFPDPRTLLQAVSASAGLEDLGQQRVDGVELTHLHATTPGALGALGIPDVSATVTSFDVWVDSADIVRQMAVSSTWGGSGFVCTVAPNSSGSSPSSGSVSIPPAARITTLPDGKPVPPGTVCGSTHAMSAGTTLDVRFADLGDPEAVAVPSGAIDQQGLG